MSVAAANQVILSLTRPVISLSGIGPERNAQLAKLDIVSLEDLLLHRPSRYEDRRRFQPIAELVAGAVATTRGTVVAMGVKWFRKRAKSVFELILSDGTARLHCRWWNLPFMEKYFAVGNEVVVFGRVQSLKPRIIDHPETEIVETGEESVIHFNRVTPVYPLTEGLPQRWLRSLIWRTVSAFEGKIPEPWPADILQSHGSGGETQIATSHKAGVAPGLFPTRAQAIRMLHFPQDEQEADAARRRLALDEFVELQRQFQARRQNLETKARALPCGGNNRLLKPFLANLGFKLTAAQTRVLRELRQELSSAHPMRRLLQGDVGSGKTAVAACCALMSLESGYQVALMAPTEILAEQHFRSFVRWFKPLGVKVQLQTGNRNEAQQLTPHSPGLPNGEGPGANGEPMLTIGTHALIGGGYNPEKLGLVLIDEQHRFGVAQREQLLRKGHYPHLLVMTATPIPRTLGLTLYGELDISVLDEMPPGRGTVKTFIRSADKLPKVWDFIRGKLKEGRQAYVVYPRVEDAGPNGIKSVLAEFEKLARALSPFRVGVVHGQLKTRQRDEVMQDFRRNRIQVLLATSLIEVGVDVPNATVMVVENAEQFGLAQLHQLRGRIGRGAHDAFCVLIAQAREPKVRERLRVLEETNDGFRVAEADLKLRGPGEMLGQQQSGIPKFRFGDLQTDLDLLELARQIAAKMVKR
jgi:ATP-dependent DNA helicase RecG